MDPVRGKSSEGGYEMKALVNAPFVRRMTKHLTEEDEAGIAAAVIPVVFGLVFAFLPAMAIGVVLGFVGYYFLLPQLDL